MTCVYEMLTFKPIEFEFRCRESGVWLMSAQSSACWSSRMRWLVTLVVAWRRRMLKILLSSPNCI